MYINIHFFYIGRKRNDSANGNFIHNWWIRAFNRRSTLTILSGAISRRRLFCPISNLFIGHCRRLFTIARFNIAFGVSPLTTVKVHRMPSIVDAKVLTGALRKKKWGEKKVRVYCDHQYKMKKRSPARRRDGKRGRIVFISTYAALISQSLPLLFLRVRPNNLHDEYARVYNNVEN